MTEEWKVFIRGVKGRGSEVIKMLDGRGGWNGYLCNGKNDKCIYYINHRGIIDFEHLNSETAKIIMDNYPELHLPEKKQLVDWKWKPDEDDEYYYIDSDGEVESDTWAALDSDIDRYNFGNCFQTVDEADAAAERVKIALKGGV